MIQKQWQDGQDDGEPRGAVGVHSDTHSVSTLLAPRSPENVLRKLLTKTVPLISNAIKEGYTDDKGKTLSSSKIRLERTNRVFVNIIFLPIATGAWQ